MNFEYVSRLIRVITHSQNLDSFCRNAVHNLWPGQRFSSVHYFTLAQDGTLHKAAGYSTSGDTSKAENIAISSNHPAAQTVKSGKACLDDKKNKAVSVPIMRDGWLFGVLVLEPLDPTSDSVDEVELLALGHALAVYIDGAMTGKYKARFEPAEQTQDELTHRQLQILRGMDEGLIYAQIASNLHVSESLVKQEASKIFRFLGVSNRAAALKAGREILEAMSPPPRRINERERELVGAS
jgi:DNA-binding CsgD family transcriptional regulator